MARRIYSKWALLLLMLGALIGGLVVVRAEGTPRADDSGNLIVHEWGTFTSFSGANGVPVPFYANDEDLPDFVYRSPRLKNDAPALVSMETPILYFYAERALTASVDVVFPRGRMTEWYPGTVPSAAN